MQNIFQSKIVEGASAFSIWSTMRSDSLIDLSVFGTFFFATTRTSTIQAKETISAFMKNKAGLVRELRGGVLAAEGLELAVGQVHARVACRHNIQ